MANLNDPLSPQQSLHAILQLIRDEVKFVHDFSGVKQFTIPAGSYGDTTYPVDLGGLYDIIRLSTHLATYIPAGTHMMTYVGPSYPAYSLCLLFEQNDPYTYWDRQIEEGYGSFDFLLSHAAGIRWIQPVLTNPVTGDTPINIYAVHKSE